MSELIYIPFIKIAQNSIVTYSIPLTRPPRTQAQEETQKNLTRGKFNGEISEKSRRQLSKRAQNWLLSIQEAKKEGINTKGKERNYTTFVTLTLASKQAHTDNVIKRKLLNTFIVYVKRQYDVKEYIWRAEAQKNGNIHFHLFIDKYIHYSKLRNMWNGIQETLGYISEFERAHHHRNANSTDIERIKSVKGASIYVAKYISKESKYRKIEGRIWGCSDGLKNVLDYTEIADSTHWSLISAVKQEPKVKEIIGDHYRVYIGDIRKVIKRDFAQLEEKVKLHYIDTYKQLYQKSTLPHSNLSQSVSTPISKPSILATGNKTTVHNHIGVSQLSIFTL